MKEIRYSEPYDYFERRKDLIFEGQVLFVNKIVNDEKKVVSEPFLIVSKQGQDVYALRLKNEKYNYKVSWGGLRPFDYKTVYTIEGKSEMKFVDHGKEASVYLESDQGTILFKVDLTKWYKLKYTGREGDETFNFLIDKVNFNYVIERIISGDPFGKIADWYSMSNWKED